MAITLFWLGKSVRSWHSGPQLDLSAFTDLVGTSVSQVSSPREESSITGDPFEQTVSSVSEVNENNRAASPEKESLDYTEDELEDIRAARELVGQSHSRQESGDSVAHSSGFSSGRSDSKSGPGSHSSESQDVIRHSRNDSYDSFISQSTNQSSNQDTSLADDEGSESSMPVTRDQLSGSLGSKPYSATLDAFYDYQDNTNQPNHQKNDSVSSQEEYDRFRFGDRTSSSGSLNKENKVMENSGSEGTRKPSRRSSQPTYNPLQFVSAQNTNPLAQKAKDTITVMSKQKEIKKTTQVNSEEEDWQSVRNF